VPDIQERLNTALEGRYHIVQQRGAGGMAFVYQARDLKHDRDVALKVLRPELAANLGVDRFVREIRIAAQLEHPHILTLIDSGEADGLLYYVMPYIEGESLREKMDREGALPIPEAARILREVADALAYAHQHGVVHRDIKPDNVLLSSGHAEIMDFGVAKAVSDATGVQSITSTGMAIGTPAYMAPEQAAADPNVDHRADIYAVGTMGYELVAGRPPFVGASPQQVLAAHVTETPSPLTDHRVDVPPGLVDAIMRSLAKLPADRWQSAGEMVPLLEAASTPSGGVTPTEMRAVSKGMRRTRWAAVAVIALVVVAVVVAVLDRGSSTAELDANLVAVAPFDVLGNDLELWHEGLVDVLSRNLDGAGPLRTVSPTVVVRRWSGRADPASAAALGRETGARLAVFGQLVGTGGDSVRLSASLLDVARGTIIGEIEVRDAVDRMDQVADSVTMALLSELGRTRPIGSIRLTSFASSSLGAVKYFLQGEQHYRSSSFDSARVYYERAVELDSSFAMAYNRLSTVWGWQSTLYDSLSGYYGTKAGELNRGLPPRDSLYIAIDSQLNAAGSMWRAGLEFQTLVRRLFASAEEATRRYPDDPGLWNMLGEVETHFGFFTGVERDQAFESLKRAIELDSAFAPLYIHPVEYALRYQGVDSAQAYIDRYLALAPSDKHADGMRLVSLLLDPTTAASAETRLFLDTASANPISTAYLALWDETDSAEVAIRLSRLLAEGRPGFRPWSNPETGRRQMFRSLARRGRVQAAADVELHSSPAILQLVALGAIPDDSAGVVFRSWLEEGNDWRISTVSWFAERGDTAAVRDYIEALANPTPFEEQVAPYTQQASQAYLALARGDTAAAVAMFREVPDSLCWSCAYVRLTRVRLLAATGQDSEAAQLLERRLSEFPTGLEPVWTLERGRVNERLGNREAAVDAYQFVADVWRHADPDLQPYVDEAKAGLERLTAEPR
jgi:serine/threonine-protein kinase